MAWDGVPKVFHLESPLEPAAKEAACDAAPVSRAPQTDAPWDQRQEQKQEMTRGDVELQGLVGERLGTPHGDTTTSNWQPVCLWGVHWAAVWVA